MSVETTSAKTNLEQRFESDQGAPESPGPLHYLQMVLAACGLTFKPQEITILRDGNVKGRQAVFNVANTWIVRIFELHDKYRQPAALIGAVLKALEAAGAPSERIYNHGIIPDTALHYTVTKFVEGIPLTAELCKNPSVREKIASLYRTLRELRVPDAMKSVDKYMGPRLQALSEKLSKLQLPAEVLEKIGKLAGSEDEFRAEFGAFEFRMVASHCDLAPENIIGQADPLSPVSVIDWEFCAYVPEFRVGAQFRGESDREVWGEDFLFKSGYRPYPEKIIWTEALCMLAEDYDGPDFERELLGMLRRKENE
ncbi:hypothetical protein C8R43DRAFT_1197111 [Mycena crocata]|nr:hypothetical protein C8R43DRAFT_1197111 [Mycena crocata]